jgi:hypothetical protein
VDRVFSLISVHGLLTADDGVGFLGMARGSYPVVEGKKSVGEERFVHFDIVLRSNSV